MTSIVCNYFYLSMTLKSSVTNGKFFHCCQTAKEDFNQADDADASEETQGATYENKNTISCILMAH